MDIPKFIIFHQPKTAGTYALRCLPTGYVKNHYNNYNWCLKNNLISKNTKLVCIIRTPIDYYISLINFWCLDPKYCKDIKNNSITKLESRYKNNTDHIGHPSYWISNGYTERNLINILNNLLSDEFIHNNKNKLSIKHHTYDHYVFSIMEKLDIGFYTFSFLSQNSRKNVNDIQNTQECREEIKYIYENFIVINTENITKELKQLCDLYSVPFSDAERTIVSSITKPNYNITNDLLEKIKYKDRYIFEFFFNNE